MTLYDIIIAPYYSISEEYVYYFILCMYVYPTVYTVYIIYKYVCLHLDYYYFYFYYVHSVYNSNPFHSVLRRKNLQCVSRVG